MSRELREEKTLAYANALAFAVAATLTERTGENWQSPMPPVESDIEP